MERAYKTMTSAGVASLVAGIVMAAVGLAAGIISIVNGARLLKDRRNITF